MRTVKFIGNINTIQPVNITLPNTKGMPRSQGRPMIPASSLRGFIRHCAHEGITLLFDKHDKPMDIDFHYLLASGVDTGRVLGVSGQNTKVGANQQIRAKHPMLSLFGYWGLSGKLSVGNAVADNDNALLKVNAGARQHVFNRNEELSNFIDPSELDRLQDILDADKYSAEAIADYKAEKKELPKKIRETSDPDEKAAYKQRSEELDVLIRDAKDSRVGASESIQRPLEQFEAIDAGQMLPHRMLLKDPTDQELHLALWSIAMASLKPYVGGHTNANYGEIHAKWEVMVTDIDNLTPKSLGHVGFNDEGFFHTIEGFDVDEITKQIVDGTINIGSFVE
ncbi:hypothetical protein ACTXIV_13065 [Psychrobacter celer]|uniref:hypothetical protein n=1 Tax=Psychrobacter celer TaxID=306572 RepID=UPI003FD310CF